MNNKWLLFKISDQQKVDYQIKQIMKNFDFEKVHSVMVHLGWEWAASSATNGVPTLQEVKLPAERLLRSAARSFLGSKKLYGHGFKSSIASGGFRAECLDDGTLTLDFSMCYCRWHPEIRQNWDKYKL